MKNLIKFLILLCVVFNVSFGSQAHISALTKTGFSSIQEVQEVPPVLKGTMLVVAVKEEDKEIVTLDYAVNMGKVYDDYLTFEDQTHRFNHIYQGIYKGRGAVAIFSSGIFLHFVDMPEDAKHISRFMLQMIRMDTGYSVKFFLK